jgi:hypothetical protein
VTAIIGTKKDISHALSVSRETAAEANSQARSMGCGNPFRSDGTFEGTRSEKKKYMKELNRRRMDRGESRIVNYDGGYGDEC